MHIIHKQYLQYYSFMGGWIRKKCQKKKLLGGAVVRKSCRTLDPSLTVDLKAAVLKLELIFLLLEFRDCWILNIGVSSHGK